MDIKIIIKICKYLHAYTNPLFKPLSSSKFHRRSTRNIANVSQLHTTVRVHAEARPVHGKVCILSRKYIVKTWGIRLITSIAPGAVCILLSRGIRLTRISRTLSTQTTDYAYSKGQLTKV